MSDAPDTDAIRIPDPRMIAMRVAPPARGVLRQHAPLREQASEPRSSDGSPIVERGGADLPGDAGVRPFVVTNGRTAPVDERLRIETQVVATRDADGFVLDFECKRIVELCRTPLSVAEIGAALELPLIVARVLVADLAAIGAVAVQEQEASVSRELLERILERVHAL